MKSSFHTIICNISQNSCMGEADSGSLSLNQDV